jgi:hypothetical protein
MAPRFKQLLYQTYDGSNGATAFVGFPVGLFEQISSFRNVLRDEFKKTTGFEYRTDTGFYEDVDVHVRFFDIKDAEIVNAFYSKPWPGCFSMLFRTRSYREHKAEEAKVEPLIKIEITTSHDFPCVVVAKSIHTEDAISQLIEQIARQLNLSIVRSRFGLPMNLILRSNRSFDARA